ncbi:MAG: AsmA family protein [Bacteroidetes bacterium]|nr:AsmA family protein [Bacteroidota bacterium]
MKLFLKRIFLCTGVLVLLIVVAAVVLPKIYHEQIRTDLEKEIDQQINADVTFSAVELKLFKHFPNLTLRVQDLIIKGHDEFRHDTLTAIKETSLEVNLWSLLTKREIELNSIHLVNPEINLYVLKDGKTNYDVKKKKDSAVASKPSSINIAIDKISIDNGVIKYTDWKRNVFIEAFDIDHTGGGDFNKDIFDYETITTIRQFSLSYDKVQYLFRKALGLDLIMEINLPESKYTFKKNKIQINHFIFSINGFLQQVVDEFAMKMKFQAEETSFKNILSLVPGLYLKNFDYFETSGDLAFSGSLDGVYSATTKETPAFHFDLNVKNAMVKIDSLPEAFNNIQFDMVIDNPERIIDSTVIDVKNFHVELGKHPVHGKIKVQGLYAPKIDADVFADLELASLERLYPVKGVSLKGKIDFELKAKGIINRDISRIPVFNLNLKLSNGAIQYDSLPRPISNIQFHLNAENTSGDLANTKINLHQMHAEVDDNILHGYAKLSGYPDTEVDADIDADIDLADIEKIYPINGYALKGHYSLDLMAKGLYSKINNKFPRVDTKIKLSDGFIQYKDFPPLKNIHFYAEALSKSGTLSDAKMNIDKLTYTLEDEPFDITGSLTDLNNYKYELTVNGKMDLAKVAQLYPMEGVTFSGLVDAQLKTGGLISDLERGDYSKTQSNGKIVFSGINIAGSKVPNPININSAFFDFTPSKIRLKNFNGKFGKSTVSIKGDVTNYMAFVTKNNDMINGDLELLCDTLSLSQWMPPPRTATGKIVPLQDTAHSKLRVIEVPRNINFIFDSRIGAVQYEDLKIFAMNGDIVFKEGVMSLHETGFNSLDAQFNVRASYDTRSWAHPLFYLDLNVKDLDINRAYREVKLVRDLAPSAANTYGKFSVDYKLKGELKKDLSPKLETLEGGGTLHIADAKIKGMKLFEEISKSAKKNEINDPHLKDFSMQTEIKDNKIIVKPFSIKVAGFDADIEGVNTMAGEVNYLVKIELIPLTKIKIPFHVTGMYNNPKVALGKGHKLPY